MIRKTFIIAVLIVGFITIGSFTKTYAGCVAVGTTVFFDIDNQEVGGISETYFTYDIAYYYDAGAEGVLYYTNPTDVIDGDIGEGIDDTYVDILCGVMYGIEVDYTTSDYRPNKILCADTFHYARLISTPIPFSSEPYYDPYGFSAKSPATYENWNVSEISGPKNIYSPNDIEPVDYTYACIRTPTVGSVTFETINSNITNDNPTGDFGNGVVFGGGQRIFPDRQTHNDTINRRTVSVKAQLTNSGGEPSFTSGAKVYFRNFDVDDPSNDTTIDDNGNLGNDNRESRGTPESAGVFSSCTATNNGCYALTNSNGEATATFEVTRQPGDNFVIAASTDKSYLDGVSINGVGLKDIGNQNLPTSQAKRTNLLTVWRKLHLEVDSMSSSVLNYVSGRIRQRITVGATPVWVDVGSLNPSGDLEPTRFEGGSMVSGSHRFEVLDNTEDQVQIQSNNGNVTLFYNALLLLYDDDDFNNNDGSPPTGDGTLDGDDNEDITCLGTQPKCLNGTFSRMQPTTDINTNVFAAAYLEPEYDWAIQQGFNETDTSFFENIDNLDALGTNERSFIDPWRNSKNTSTNTYERRDFWVAYVQVGYQWDPIFDGDPILNPPLVGGGIAPVYSPKDLVDDADEPLDVFRGSIGNLIFIESMRDADDTLGSSVYDLKTRIAPHEIGHQLGLQGHTAVFGIMDINSITDKNRLVPRHISVIRWRIPSPGEEDFTN